ncbi:MBL fold metallo-hydrolase [Cereibacter sediminicola]|uniref:MBL fold metallo-hydrolase n=1 Tax=Cereibacter sediminicola TaxID=2584941 RepID=UPI0011A4CAE4|nr:MBL fold metallo-hydrolase [Cereibacter sediminicola]
MIRPALASLVLAFPVAAEAQERTPSHCIALAEGPERVMSAAFGDPLAEDRVRIRYVHHATFLIETPGGLVAATDYTGMLGQRDVVPDVATMNNAHSTHWTDFPDPRIAHVLPGWQEGGRAEHHLDLGEMLVRNVPTDVRSRWGEGVRKDGNSIFVFEVAGLCIGHLGHLHHEPDAGQYAALGRLDVLMVPVDGGYTVNLETMQNVVSRLRSSVVLPMHWFSGRSLEMFLSNMQAEFELVRIEGPELELSLDSLPRRPTIMVLDPAWVD